MFKNGKRMSVRMGTMPYAIIVLSLLLIEIFGFVYLQNVQIPLSKDMVWPLAFGFSWTLILSAGIWLLGRKTGRIAYGVIFFLSFAYAVGQTGYYHVFQQMMWISDFLYASEGADYLDVLLSFPLSWYVWLVALAGFGMLCLWKFPSWKRNWKTGAAAAAVCLFCSLCIWNLPEKVFEKDENIQFSGTDYGRAKSMQAAYEEMFNAHRLYKICGLYHMAAKDIYAHGIYPLTPGYLAEHRQGWEQIRAYFANDTDSTERNSMTGIFADKNVVLVLMESMDDWMIGSFTPTLSRLAEEGISFTNFYTPPYGGVRTFNTEFCINTGSFLSSQGGYAFDYVTNQFHHSLANQFRNQGYSAKLFHYNEPGFYSRDVFSKALGYEEYVCYADYLQGQDEETIEELLYDDCLLFDNQGLKAQFFRPGKKLNFVITRSAHLSYKYNEVLSHWGLKKYPGFRGLTWNEETDCALLKAKLVDDLFARLLQELELHGELENTVIIGITDHYTYGYKDMDNLLMLSGVTEELLLEKTPFFIWASGMEGIEVKKTMNTSDFLPTVLNLFGIQTVYDYIGHDAFADTYTGFVPFSNGSWITENHAYNAASEKLLTLKKTAGAPSAKLQGEMSDRTWQFVQINNLILETDFYQ